MNYLIFITMVFTTFPPLWMASVVKERIPKGTVAGINCCFGERKKERIQLFFKEYRNVNRFLFQLIMLIPIFTSFVFNFE